METIPQPIDISAPKARIYSETAIVTATVIGGLLAPVYMYIWNLRAMSQPVNALKIWGYGVVGLLLLIGLGIRLPDSIGPGLIVGVVFGVRGFIQMNHSPAIKQYVSDGGETFSLWRAVGIALISLVITAVLAVCSVLIFL